MSRVIPFPAVASLAHDETVVGPERLSLATVVAASRRRHRKLIVAAGRWALARGVAVAPDHVALWAATVETLGWAGNPGGITGPWRVSAMPGFVSAVRAWCRLNGCRPPAELNQSLWRLYGFLAETGRLDPASDSLAELRAALVVFGDMEQCSPTTVSPFPAPTAA